MNKPLLTCLTAAYAAAFPLAAHAYIDPGSGAAIITAILGALGAINYTFRKYYYKIKKFFSRQKDTDQ